MTTLFTHLAARSLGLTPIVQPRIDSMFSAPVSVERINPGVSLTASEQATATLPPSRSEGVIAPLLVSPAANQNAPMLPIAHAPRSIAMGTLTSSTRGHDVLGGDDLEPNATSPDRSFIRSDRSISETISDISSDTESAKIETNIEINSQTNIKTNSQTNSETNSATPIRSVLDTNRAIHREIHQNTHVASSPIPNSAGQKADLPFSEIPRSRDSVMPLAAASSSPVTENLTPIETTSSTLPKSVAQQSIDPDQPLDPLQIDPLQRRSGIEPSRSSLFSPQQIHPVSTDRTSDPGKPLDAVMPRDRSSNSFAAASTSVRPDLLKRDPASISPSQIAPQAVPQIRQSSNKIEIRPSQSIVPDVLPGIMPRQTAPLSALLPSDRSSFRAAEREVIAPPPTIQVTIGRIEVRAVSTPPPARPRAATPSARLSLEDYLRSRSAGNPSGGNP